MSKIIVKDLEGPSSSSNKIYIASGSQLDIAGSPGGAGAINLAVDGGDITTGTVANARLADGHILQTQIAYYKQRFIKIAMLVGQTQD